MTVIVDYLLATRAPWRALTSARCVEYLTLLARLAHYDVLEEESPGLDIPDYQRLQALLYRHWYDMDRNEIEAIEALLGVGDPFGKKGGG